MGAADADADADADYAGRDQGVEGATELKAVVTYVGEQFFRRASSFKALVVFINHVTFDSDPYVAAAFAGNDDLVVDRTSNLVLMFRTLGDMLPCYQTYNAQEQSLEVLCRLYAGQKASLPDCPTDILSLQPAVHGVLPQREAVQDASDHEPHSQCRQQAQ